MARAHSLLGLLNLCNAKFIVLAASALHTFPLMAMGLQRIETDSEQPDHCEASCPFHPDAVHC